MLLLLKNFLSLFSKTFKSSGSLGRLFRGVSCRFCSGIADCFCWAISVHLSPGKQTLACSRLMASLAMRVDMAQCGNVLQWPSVVMCCIGPVWQCVAVAQCCDVLQWPSVAMCCSGPVLRCVAVAQYGNVLQWPRVVMCCKGPVLRCVAMAQGCDVCFNGLVLLAMAQGCDGTPCHPLSEILLPFRFLNPDS